MVSSTREGMSWRANQTKKANDEGNSFSNVVFEISYSDECQMKKVLLECLIKLTLASAKHKVAYYLKLN